MSQRQTTILSQHWLQVEGWVGLGWVGVGLVLGRRVEHMDGCASGASAQMFEQLELGQLPNMASFARAAAAFPAPTY